MEQRYDHWSFLRGMCHIDHISGLGILRWWRRYVSPGHGEKTSHLVLVSSHLVHLRSNDGVLILLPLYFQAVMDASPLKSGVDLLPLILSQMLASIVSGVWGECLNPCSWNAITDITYSEETGILFAVHCRRWNINCYLGWIGFNFQTTYSQWKMDRLSKSLVALAKALECRW